MDLVSGPGQGHGLVLRLILLWAVLAPAFCIAKEPSITIYLEPSLSEKSMTVWYGFALARIKYREDRKLPIPRRGIVSPSLDEEVYARAFAVQIYQELKNENKGLRENYWETLSQIKTEGFMDAYVWTYLRQPNWPKSQRPKNLSTFEIWRRSHLNNHKAMTYSSLVVEK